jgi:hypothetical protein
VLTHPRDVQLGSVLQLVRFAAFAATLEQPDLRFLASICPAAHAEVQRQHPEVFCNTDDDLAALAARFRKSDTPLQVVDSFSKLTLACLTARTSIFSSPALRLPDLSSLRVTNLHGVALRLQF